MKRFFEFGHTSTHMSRVPSYEPPPHPPSGKSAPRSTRPAVLRSRMVGSFRAAPLSGPTLFSVGPQVSATEDSSVPVVGVWSYSPLQPCRRSSRRITSKGLTFAMNDHTARGSRSSWRNIRWSGNDRPVGRIRRFNEAPRSSPQQIPRPQRQPAGHRYHLSASFNLLGPEP